MTKAKPVKRYKKGGDSVGAGGGSSRGGGGKGGAPSELGGGSSRGGGKGGGGPMSPAMGAPQIAANTAATAKGIPAGAYAPMGGGVSAGALNMANPLTRGNPAPGLFGGLFGGRPLFGEGGFLPADSRSGMSAAERAAELVAQGGGGDGNGGFLTNMEPIDPAPAVPEVGTEVGTEATDSTAMPTDKPAWWPAYLPWPPNPGSPYAPITPVPFTQYGTSYNSLQNAINTATNPLMMGIGGILRRR